MPMQDPNRLARDAGLALQTQDRAGFVVAIDGLLAVNAPLGDRWKALAQPLIHYGELGRARDAMTRYVRAANFAPRALFDQAVALAQMGRPADATRVLSKIARAVPDRVNNAYLRGTLALNLGDSAAARDALLDAHAARPGDGQILQTLSMLGSLASDANLADRIFAAQGAMSGASPADRASYGYALGKTLNDLGEYDRAFAAFAAGAAHFARERPYDAAADRAGADAATAGWDPAALARIARAIDVATTRPIMVTGLPRSGSTLVEQILVSHSQVADGDELGRFGLVVDAVGGVGAAALATPARSAPADAARLYLHLLDERFGTTGRVVDKTLEASRYLGTFAALLPDAPILWLRRDPLDNAWSCFSTYFLTGLAWSWDQVAIARHFALEDELLARWTDLLGDRIKVVDYAELVIDKAAVIPALLAHCGLAMEPQALSPEQTPRLVTTASVSQVRAPINTRALGSGQRYAEHFQPFIDAYGYRG